MRPEYRKVAYRGKRLSDMSEDDLRAALYQVYAERKALRDFAIAQDRFWARISAAFAEITWPARKK